MLVGTLVEAWHEVNPFPTLPTTFKESDTLVMKVLQSFSILSNGKEVLSTETSNSHITCLSGIRTISMFWIIYGHLYLVGEFLLYQGYVTNKKEMEDVSWNLLISLDTDSFFYLIDNLWTRILDLPACS